MTRTPWRMSGYRVEELIGAGATGEVWRARVSATNVPVALKRIPLSDATQRATALSDSSDFVWRVRFYSQLSPENSEAAVATLEAMAQGRGRALNGMPIEWLWTLKNNLDHAGNKAGEMAVLKVLADPAYQPDDVDTEIDDDVGVARVEYAGALLAHGEADAARAQLGDIDSLSAAVEANFTPAIRALLPHAIDLRAVVEHELARHRALMAAHPDSLDAINATSIDLRRLGRPKEAIATLETVRARIGDADAFVDREERLPWWWNALAYAHADLGEYDATMAAFHAGAAVNENGVPNVSQYINLADAELKFGHYDKALQALADFDTRARAASPFGVMQVRAIRGCALARKGDRDGARQVFDEALAHEKDDPATVTELALCRNDEAAAASSYIRRLADPDAYRRAMLSLARYDPPNSAAPVDPGDAVRDRVRARPDVSAALARYGGAPIIHLQHGTVY